MLYIDNYAELEAALCRTPSCEGKLILLGGYSNSGKSTISKRLLGAMEAKLHIPGCILSLDAWIIDHRKRHKDSTVLERYEVDAVLTAFSDLKAGLTVHPPEYDRATRSRISEHGTRPVSLRGRFIIVEGVIALALHELFDYAIARIYIVRQEMQRLLSLRKMYLETKKMPRTEYARLLQKRERQERKFIADSGKNANIIFYNQVG